MAEMDAARQMIGRFLAVVLLATHLFVMTMTLCPALHHWLHGDSDESDHHCAVTAMIDGQLDRPDVPSLAVAGPVVVAEPRLALVPAQPWSALFHAAPGERAPPSA